MSRAGRVKPEPVDEVKPGDIRLLSPAEPPPPPTLEQRAIMLHGRCKGVVVGPYMALWPGESIGAAIAEQWLQEVQQWAYKLALEKRQQEQAGIGDHIEVVRHS